ncbi:hypothetical protein V1264_013664 [Littorina saxatilis]|uniref:C2H2-type domain-containing protein n=1 Tax=Littorina saxatilis TaxID=31220 RepID=A0AAN9BQV3_9CAEN
MPEKQQMAGAGCSESLHLAPAQPHFVQGQLCTRENKTLEEFVVRVEAQDSCSLMWACRACQRWFRTKTGLHRHVRKLHMDDPKFRCRQCGHGFMTREHFTGHMNMHTGVQGFQCPHCPQRYTYRGDLYRHKKKCTGSGMANTAS